MSYSFIIEPNTYTAFEDETDQLDQCKSWGLLSDKAAKTKIFLYKGNGKQLNCSIVGYVDAYTAVVSFDNGDKHCIHPAFLKEMQASTYGQRAVIGIAADNSGAAVNGGGAESEAAAVNAAPGAPVEEAPAAVNVAAPAPVEEASAAAPEAAPAPGKPAAAATAASSAAPAKEPAAGKKPKASGKVQLPEEKVKMTAVVKEFTTVPNHFADEDDEVIIYDAVAIVEPELELGMAWSSYSATLKKLELEVGDSLTFECKIVAKKLTKHPVPYKINNPSRIQKV
ncbi:hypothetical protein [Paenibacillus koleovorans]|uniref:hypothetical protein n=1 Tax=Paenibacillus koleovorans TaxID=121608 RepID=UPI000FD85D89|nr:hypothetical protein [Paenibacillus koleovorans]